MQCNAMYSSTVQCNAAQFHCAMQFVVPLCNAMQNSSTVQCNTVKADHGDSAPATSWRAPPMLHYIAPHCAAHDPNRPCTRVQFSALAGDKQLEEELRASLKCSLPVRGGAPPGFYSPNWKGVATSGARSKCSFHLPQQ